MRKRAKYSLCVLLLLALTTATWAGDSFTARIPAAMAAGNYAEAEMLIAEALKIGAITAVAAESYRREIQQAPKRKPNPDGIPPPLSDGPDSETDTDGKKKQGRIYVTYTKFNQKTMRYYLGRTSMVIDMDKPLRPQAEAAVAARNSNHHIDQNDEPKEPAFEEALMDKFDVGTAVNYENRYSDIAYIRIRGREQQLIDFYGGAQSDTRKAGQPDRTENALRAVARDNKLGRQFHEAATAKWGMLAKYTGD